MLFFVHHVIFDFLRWKIVLLATIKTAPFSQVTSAMQCYYSTLRVSVFAGDIQMKGP